MVNAVAAKESGAKPALARFEGPIALIEDNEEDAFLIARHLNKNAGVDTQHFESGSAFRAAVANGGQSFRFVMIALSMKIESGLELLKWIRQEPSLKRAVVLAVGNSTRPTDIQEALDLGANGYYAKGLHFEQLSETIKTLEFFR